jgi:hypothetical protein
MILRDVVTRYLQGGIKTNFTGFSLHLGLSRSLVVWKLSVTLVCSNEKCDSLLMDLIDSSLDVSQTVLKLVLSVG